MAKTKVFHEGFAAGVKESEDVSQNLHVMASALKSWGGKKVRGKESSLLRPD